MALRRYDSAQERELDGGWWPRTRQPIAELKALVAGLEPALEGVTRLSLNGIKWAGTPDRLRLGERDVPLIWFSLRDPHTVIVAYGLHEITLLVVPPEVTPAAGARAMTMASDRHNTTDPAGILQASAAIPQSEHTASRAANRVESVPHRLSPSMGPAGSATGRGGAAPTMPPRLPAYTQDAGAYDRCTAAFHDFRAAIVDALPLHRGQVVLDVGCGTGLSFASLLDKVGPYGRIVGIDASPEMLAVARARVAREGWGNINLVQSPVIDAQIPVIADAAIFCAVHDILRSPKALRRVLDKLLPGTWVTAGGGKWAAPWMVPLNWQVRALHKPYVHSFEGFHRPWSHLERLIEDVRVRIFALGSGYVMTGRVPQSSGSSTVMQRRGDRGA